MSAGTDVWGDRTSSGPPQPFFGSRWTPLPEHVRELDPARRPARRVQSGRRRLWDQAVRQPRSGDRSSAIHERPVSAARFTATATPAAPVLLSQERCRLDGLRAVLANSGCANAETGQRGLDDAAKTQGAAAIALGVQPEEVVLGSTGGISWHLPVDAVLRGISTPARDCAARATPTSSRRSRRPMPSRSALPWRSSCRRARFA